MEAFVVRQRWDTLRTVTFEDTRGRLHHARATACLPEVGETLFGHSPKLGFTILFGSSQGQVFRVIFETLSGDDTADGAAPG